MAISNSPHLYILRTLKAQREFEVQGTPKPLKHQLFHCRMESNLRQSPARKQVQEQALPIEPPKPLNPRLAELKRLQNQQHSWIRKRSKSDDVLHKVQECLRALYSILNPNKAGLIAAKDLISQLISLGLSTDPNTIVKVLLAIYKQKELNGLYLTLDQMLELSRVDRVTNRLLTLLSTMANESISLSTRSPKGYISPAQHYRTDIAPWRDGKMSLADYMQQLRILWSETCTTDHKPYCEFEEMATSLVQLNIYADRLEVYRAYQELREIEEISSSLVTFIDFQNFFAKSMFKGALVNLANRLGKGVGGLMTPKLVISLYQRRLLLAGLQGASDLSRDEGVTTLKAVEEYSKMY